MRNLIKKSKEKEKIMRQHLPRVNNTQNTRRNRDLNSHRKSIVKVQESKISKGRKKIISKQIPTSFQHHSKFHSVASKFSSKSSEFQNREEENQKEIEDKLSIDKLQKVVDNWKEGRKWTRMKFFDKMFIFALADQFERNVCRRGSDAPIEQIVDSFV